MRHRLHGSICFRTRSHALADPGRNFARLSQRTGSSHRIVTLLGPFSDHHHFIRRYAKQHVSVWNILVLHDILRLCLLVRAHRHAGYPRRFARGGPDLLQRQKSRLHLRQMESRSGLINICSSHAINISLFLYFISKIFMTICGHDSNRATGNNCRRRKRDVSIRRVCPVK